jgi:uncharacterized protein (UPF0335 family)
MSGYVKYIIENGQQVRVPDEERNISEIERLEKEIAELQDQLNKLKQN